MQGHTVLSLGQPNSAGARTVLGGERGTGQGGQSGSVLACGEDQ